MCFLYILVQETFILILFVGLCLFVIFILLILHLGLTQIHHDYKTKFYNYLTINTIMVVVDICGNNCSKGDNYHIGCIIAMDQSLLSNCIDQSVFQFALICLFSKLHLISCNQNNWKSYKGTYTCLYDLHLTCVHTQAYFNKMFSGI